MLPMSHAPSTELNSPNTASIVHVLQIQLLILLALRVEVYPTDTPITLIEADIIKALKTGTCDRFHAMVRHEEVFFPTHEDMFPLLVVLQCERG